MTCFDSILILYASLILDPLFITSFFLLSNAIKSKPIYYCTILHYLGTKNSKNMAMNLDRLSYYAQMNILVLF